VSGRGAAFTPDLIGDLAEAVLSVRAGMVTLHGPLNDWIREVISIPSAELASATPEDLAPASWSIRPWAVALVLHEHEAAGVNEAAVRSQMIAIEATLGQALTGFRHGLDQDALRVTESYPKQIAGDIYRHLASPAAHRRNRIQLGSQFPCLLPLVFAESGDSEWSLLRIANDRGHSAIDSAANLLGVRTSTIRTLRSAPADLFLDCDHPAGVIRLLDLCRPESRPTDVAGWHRLRNTLAAAEEGFGSLQTTFLTRAVVRAMLHRHGARIALEPGQVPDGAVRALEDARRAILASAEAERARLAYRSSKSSGPAPSVLSGHAADRWLVERFSIKQLVALTDAWRRAWDDARNADAPAHEFADGQHQRYWSLISGELQTSCGLMIAPVSSPAALRTVGELQNLCLAKSHFEQYDRACRQGRAYLVVVRQGQGRILSTARIELASTEGQRVIRVVEHQGQANSPPPSDCVAALVELDSHIRTSEAAQCHIELGLRLQRARRSSRPRELVSIVESGTQIKALQIALGQALVADVVRLCVEATQRSAS
jgi:hypothetical protein